MMNIRKARTIWNKAYKLGHTHGFQQGINEGIEMVLKKAESMKSTPCKCKAPETQPEPVNNISQKMYFTRDD